MNFWVNIYPGAPGLQTWQRGTAGAGRSLSGDDYYNEKVRTPFIHLKGGGG